MTINPSRSGRAGTRLLALIIFTTVLLICSAGYKFADKTDKALQETMSHYFVSVSSLQAAGSGAGRAAAPHESAVPSRPAAAYESLPDLAQGSRSPAVPLPQTEAVNDLDKQRQSPAQQTVSTAADKMHYTLPTGQSSVAVVPPTIYHAIYNAWMRSGGAEGKELSGAEIRITNLKEMYPLLQMKPVAIINKSRFIDLETGDSVSESSLNEYSKTVFEVSSPRAIWGKELRHCRLQPNDSIRVCYYMYPFIRNAIFSRASQAVAWARSQVPYTAGKQQDEITIIGCAIVIQRQGGGKFAIYIPQSITKTSGQEVNVPASIFLRDKDVAIMARNGLLRETK